MGYFTYEYKLLGTHNNGLIKEQVNTIKLGLLLSENWFYKSKFEDGELASIFPHAIRALDNELVKFYEKLDYLDFNKK